MTGEVSTFLDRMLEVQKAPISIQRPNFISIEAKFGGKRAWAELRRQVELRDSDYLYGCFLDPGARDEQMHRWSIRGLNSKDSLFHKWSLSWCCAHSDMLDEGQRKAVREILVKAVKATAGKDMDRQALERLATFATQQDLPWLRKIYQDHFFEREPSYRVTLPVYRTLTRSHFLLVLARIGDANAKTEIALAIGQEASVEQRVWGVFMAANLGDRSLVPLIGKALEDKRRAPEPIEEWRDPAAKGPYLLRVAYHRVCDVAVRAVWTIDAPKDSWPFAMNVMAGLRRCNWTFLHGMSNEVFPYVEPLEKKANQDRGVFLNHVILGYTDEQLEGVRGYLKTRPALPQEKEK